MIAISYRREDSTPVAGRLHDRLRAEFGKENVFMDFDSIPYGVDFREHIKRTLERADVVVAVIGSGWLGEQRDAPRRIDDASDFVRLEIAGALQRGIPVIPILVDKMRMPKPEDLPEDIAALAFRNALILDTGIDFHHHADRLVGGIRDLLKGKAEQVAVEAAAAERPPATPAAMSEERIQPRSESETAAAKASSEESVAKTKRQSRPRKSAPSRPVARTKRIATPVSEDESKPALNWKLIGSIGGAVVALFVIYSLASWFTHRNARSTSTFADTANVQPSPIVSPSPAVVAAPTIAPAPPIAPSESPIVATSLPPPPFSSPAATIVSAPVPTATPYVSPFQEEEEVRQAVRDYYAALSRHDLDAIVSKFGDEVDYQGQGHHDRRYIRIDTGNYLRRWDRIAFETGPIDVKRLPEGDYMATFNFPFAVGQGRAPDKRGVSASVWIFRKDGRGEMQIVSQREKVLTGHSRSRRY